MNTEYHCKTSKIFWFCRFQPKIFEDQKLCFWSWRWIETVRAVERPGRERGRRGGDVRHLVLRQQLLTNFVVFSFFFFQSFFWSLMICSPNGEANGNTQHASLVQLKETPVHHRLWFKDFLLLNHNKSKMNKSNHPITVMHLYQLRGAMVEEQ